jgi:hypothetical protein
MVLLIVKILQQDMEIGKPTLLATPSQLCEAMLRATNKWIEE